MASSSTLQSTPVAKRHQHPTLELKFLATAYPIIPLDECTPESDTFERVVAEYARKGYAGFDFAVLHILLLGQARVAAALSKHGMKIMGKVYSDGHSGSIPSLNPKAMLNATVEHPPQGPSVQEHIAVWTQQVREIARPDAILRPFLLGIASQGGRDRFTSEEIDTFFTACIAVADEIDLPVYHETHRHRVLFNVWDVPRILQRHPRLRLLGDLSHYCVVSELPPDDVELCETISKLFPFIGHIHARVGFEEGPQILDPREERWSRHVKAHAVWWKDIIKCVAKKQREAGSSSSTSASSTSSSSASSHHQVQQHITCTPEFLPPPYAWTQHSSNSSNSSSALLNTYPGAAVVNVHEINHYMMEVVKGAYEEAMKELDMEEEVEEEK